ncbi:MAG TPA: hypothetical protein VFU30_09535 [Gaiellaceae bacterium]|nr:hypothetical protein [Gaiellaceae bacterium]
MAASIAVALAAYGATADANAASDTSRGAKILVGRSSLGRIIVDGKGRTLYLFAKDKGRNSACYGACAAYWPPLLTHGKPVAGTGVKQRLLGTTLRTNGATQVTYAGHPLYRYLGDSRPGDSTGEGLLDFGAEWDVLSPAGSKIDG